jgi:hypothetical protein
MKKPTHGDKSPQLSQRIRMLDHTLRSDTLDDSSADRHRLLPGVGRPQEQSGIQCCHSGTERVVNNLSGMEHSSTHPSVKAETPPSGVAA